MKTKKIHISDVRPGDIVNHNGAMRTVSQSDIRRSEFMGVTLFGDCYRLGYKPVALVVSIPNPNGGTASKWTACA